MKKLLFHMLIPAVLAVLMLPMTVFAMEVDHPVSIPVEITVSGTSVPTDVEYKLVLEAIDNAPMPEMSEISIKDGGKAAFGPITYTVPDNYHYKIYQKSEAKDNFTYDNTVYEVTVQVLNDGKGGFKANVVGSKDGSSGKPADFKFVNSYKKPHVPVGPDGPPGGGDHGGPKDPPTVIPTNPVPQSPGPVEIIEELIPEGVPLAVLPKTGDGSISLVTLFVLLAVSGMLAAGLIRRRRNQEQ
ncbi:MAG: FctA domain-containing protein [Lachnospiraceae bacterium]|nr:FctA domain-containing protein [Lachnospiraceae bacterium]